MVEPKFLGLFVHTLTADDKYYCHHREKFPQGIQMQLSKKASTFYQFFISFLKATSNFEHFEKKITLKPVFQILLILKKMIT